MGKFRESRTAENLLVSFAAESQAQARYIFFGNKAEEDGYIQIAKIFKETADQELEHALRFFKFFNGGEIEITYPFPAGVIRSTCENLIASAQIEHTVHTAMYPVFAGIARKENYERAAETWDAISIAERQHETTFRELAENITTNAVFKRDEKVIWRCINCGYLYESHEAPSKCPACVRPSGHFEIMAKNW